MDFESNTATNGSCNNTDQTATTNILPSDIENENFCNFNNDFVLTAKALDINNLPAANSTDISSEQTSPMGDDIHDDEDDVNTSTPALIKTPSSNGKSVTGALEDEDLGPETDVDTADEIMLSGKETDTNDERLYDFENNGKDGDIEESSFISNNPFQNDFEVAAPIKCDDDASFIEHANPFDDNKLRDMIEIDETKVAAELVEQALAKEFVSEKRDVSFEKDMFEESEFFDKLNREQVEQQRSDQFEAQHYQHSSFDRIPEEYEPRGDYNQNDEFISDPVSTQGKNWLFLCVQ